MEHRGRVGERSALSQVVVRRLAPTGEAVGICDENREDRPTKRQGQRAHRSGEPSHPQYEQGPDPAVGSAGGEQEARMAYRSRREKDLTLMSLDASKRQSAKLKAS